MRFSSWCVVVLVIVAPIWGYWFLGGINLKYLNDVSMTKAKEICGENSQIVRQGYTRSIFGGWGGHVWYQCEKENIWYTFYIARRINNPELQVYSFEQRTTFPNEFNMNTH